MKYEGPLIPTPRMTFGVKHVPRLGGAMLSRLARVRLCYPTKKVSAPQVVFLMPVSYTHLTLPTIYSV